MTTDAPAAEGTLTGAERADGALSARGDARRRQLVDATIRLAGRNGVSGTSVKDIAHAASVAPGLVHYHFAAKDDLLVAVVARLEDEIRAVWAHGTEGIVDPLDRLAAGIAALAADADVRPDRRRLLADLAAQSLTAPAVHERCKQLSQAVRADMERELRQVLGELPAYALAPPDDIAAVVAGSIDGIVMQALVCGDSPASAMHALLVMLLSVVATAHVVAGVRPPLERLRLLAQSSPRGA